MLTKIIQKVIKNINFLSSKRYISALYISGDKASETFSVLTPFIDFETQLKDKSKIVDNLQKRGLPINLEEIVCTWIFYKKFLTQRSQLEETKIKIAKSIKDLDPTKDKNEIEKLINHGKLIKNDLKALRESFYTVEENAMTKVLSLPNIIHPRAPSQTEVLFSREDLLHESAPHIEIGHQLDLLDFKTNQTYFLKNDAALFELAATNFVAQNMLQKGYTEFSNSDFSRSVVVEGCGIDFNDPEQTLTINEPDILEKHENSRLHLTGGASLPSFMAYFTKHTIFPSQLPLKFVTIARKYQPSTHKPHSLFNVSQSTCVELFLATLDDPESQNLELDNIINDIQDLYQKLGYDFQVALTPIKNLKNYEALRVSIQMFSNHLRSYVEVGHVSVLDSYVSKRLLFNYGASLNMSFPKVLSGTVFNVPKILGCLLENKKELLNDELKMYFDC